ncbi:acyltransferase family protein [Bauldia litoralis]|uniref:Peptidoglycan/LPS O-acetylase OafA/YrhL, contains acyltransferase and SGNH-hydrolase domains n=1 Tax=Bauldia litoralis TaxID=665467 RepID=A0A1G6AGR2_9HYPH|nr:acyltransferase [Bauldia litoralis]SDB07574.1 Peptidoglycan/LPS O-acetylase OafA/YrhL, contains acyltransferase and SGNH-hydrolase domains [Bauldia litoralis]
MKSSGGQRLLALDHLRALAAILVFYWHGMHSMGVRYDYVAGDWFTSLIEEGWVGVSLFMAITGFMFTVLTHGREIHYGQFLLNRFLRIFPLLFLVTLYSATYNKSASHSMMLLFNLLGGGVVFGTWTLVVEAQFYLAYPFIRDKLVRMRDGNVVWWATIFSCAALVLLMTILRAAYWYKTGEAQTMSYWTIFGRTDDFVSGIIAGLIYLRFRNRPRIWWSPIALAVSVLALLWLNSIFAQTGGFYNRPEYPSPSPLWIIYPTISAIAWSSLILTYCLFGRHFEGTLARAIGYLGAISYSTYMLHFVVLIFAKQAAESLGFLRLLPGRALENALLVLTIWHLPITLILAAISYELIEKAFLNKRRPYLGPRQGSTPAMPQGAGLSPSGAPAP